VCFTYMHICTGRITDVTARVDRYNNSVTATSMRLA